MTVALQNTQTTNTDPTVRVYGPTTHVEAKILDLWQLRDLILVMVTRDLTGKYRGSMLGLIWPVLNPLGHLALYTFVFSVVLKVKFGHDASTANFALYLMTGLTAWLALSEALTRSSTCILEVPNLVKRVVFPLEVLPVVIVASTAITAVISFVIVTIASCWYLGSIHASLAFIPLILASQLVFTVGLCWFTASIGVFVQDLSHFMSLGLSVWMYGSPIVYPASAFPASLKFLSWVNPVAGIVGDYRRVIIEGIPPDWAVFAYYTLFGIILWIAGYHFFTRTKRSFADVM